MKVTMRVLAALMFLGVGGFASANAFAYSSHRHQSTCGVRCVREYKLPVADAGPFGVTAGPDGRTWFSHGSTIGSINTSGNVRVYSLPTEAPQVGWLTLDKKRHGIWFAERNTNKIGFIKPNGAVKEYDIPTKSVANCPANNPGDTTTVPHGIVVSHDERYVWFTEECGDKIGRLGPHGTIKEYPTSAGAGPQGLAIDPKGDVWFTERYASAVGKVTRAGKVTEYPLAAGVSPQRIAYDPKDGDVWFTELLGDAIGRITMAGKIKLFPLPTGAEPVGITTAPNGDLWFVDFGKNAIGHMTVKGHLVKEYPLPTANTFALQIAWGQDRAFWVGEGNTNLLARLKP